MSGPLANTARLHQAIGVRHRRRRIPKQVPPHAVEREYALALLPFVAVARAAFDPVLRELPELFAGAAAERGDSLRTDSGEGRRLAQLIAEAKARLGSVLNTDELQVLAGRFARRISEHNRVQLVKQVRAAVGVDVFTADKRVPALVEGFVVENVELIRNIPEKVASDIAQMTTRAVASGTLHADLATQIAERTELGLNRAKLIARDQVGKLYGQINIARQRELGGDYYFWRTVGDARVRPEHVSRNGQRFAYDKPPAGGHPGEAILCRCVSEPDFDAILDDLES